MLSLTKAGQSLNAAAAYLRHYKRVRRWEVLAEVIVPPLVVYPLGWNLAWVRRGFSSGRARRARQSGVAALLGPRPK